MKFKNLLSLGAMISCGLVAQAQTQVFHESFDADQTKAATEVGYYEFINSEELDERHLSDLVAVSGKSLDILNNQEIPNDNNFWRRAVKFRNLPLQEGKSYRLTYYLQGSNMYADSKCKMRVGLMQGVENADLAILDADGNENYSEVSYFNPDAFEKYTKMIYFASKEKQDAKYDETCSGKEEYDPSNKDKYFATFNIYNPGEFFLDEVDLSESNIAGITYRADVIRVNIGYGTNAASLASAKGYYMLKNDCATVKFGGEEKAIESVELRADGYLYIFLEEELEGDSELEVTFNNPEDSGFNYSGTLTPGGAVRGFTEKAELDENFNADGEIVSTIYGEPVIESTSPLNGSFGLEGNISEFTFNFDKEVYSVKNDAKGAPVAVLEDGTVLTLKAGTPETTTSLTFVREGAELIKGNHTVTLKDIVSSKGTECMKDITLTFEVGKVKLAEAVYTDLFETLVTGDDGAVPEGWTCMVKGTTDDWTSGEEWPGGQACRNMASEGQQMFYLCDRDGFTYLRYGDQEGAGITLPAGDIEFAVIAAGHEADVRTVEFRIEDLNGNLLASAKGLTTVNAGGAGTKVTFTTVEAAGSIPVKFNNPKEQNVILKIHEPEGGYTAARIIGFSAKSYEMTAGDVSDAEVVFSEDFGTNGNMPSAESGWLCYDAGRQLEPGTGRNGTSGMLVRNYGPKMQNAFLSRECGENADAAHRLTYADENSGHEPLEIPAGSYEITFYCGTWNDATGNAAGTSKTNFQLIDAESGDVVVNESHVNIVNFGNGSEIGKVEADKVTIPFNTKGGKYSIKAWGTHNTVIGAFSIEKQGSKAAKYYSMIAEAVESAKTEATTAADEVYDGTTKSALIDAINKYSDPSNMHTAAEVEDAIAKIDSLKKAMKARREVMAEYDDFIAKCGSLIDETTGTKYEQLPAYQPLVTTYNEYKDQTAKSLEDKPLTETTTSLKSSYYSLYNMYNEGVKILTQQLVDAAALVVSLDESLADNESVLAVGDVLGHSDNLAKQLNLLATKTIYEKCAEGNPFTNTYFDEDLMDNVTEEKEISATSYIVNPNPYCVCPDDNFGPYQKISAFPGWETDSPDYSDFRPDYAWSANAWVGNQTPGHNVNGNVMLGIGYVGDYGTTVWTNVKDLPVGKYNLVIKTMDRSGVGQDDTGAYVVTEPEKQQSYIYYKQGDADMVTTPFKVDDIGQWYNFTECPMEGIDLTGDVTAEVQLGAYIHAYGFAGIQKVSLTMVAKAEGFDYAAAAKKVAEDYAADVKSIEKAPEGEPTSVEYYSLDGKAGKVAGVNIKVEKWANGYMKISKVVIK